MQLTTPNAGIPSSTLSSPVTKSSSMPKPESTEYRCPILESTHVYTLSLPPDTGSSPLMRNSWEGISKNIVAKIYFTCNLSKCLSYIHQMITAYSISQQDIKNHDHGRPHNSFPEWTNHIYRTVTFSTVLIPKF